MKKNTRSGFVFLVAFGLAALGYVAFNANRAPAASISSSAVAAEPGAFPVAVEVVKVSASDFLDEVSAVGTLKSKESVVLRPEIAGRILSIGFKDGAVVAQGARLVSLDAAVQEAELQQAKANLGLAETSFKRNQELVAKKFLSQQALDISLANLKLQQATVQLAAAKLAKTQVRAPFGGMLGLRNVSVGDYVKEGQDLINLEDISTLRVDFRLPENYLGRLSQGQTVTLTTDALPGQTFKALLDAVDPMVDQNGRAISARARLDNAAAKLRPGMFVRVRVLFGQRKNVLMLPEQAIVPGAQPAVFRIVDDKAQRVPVKLGLRRAAEVEVVDGLQAGDVVVTAGQLKLRDGVLVRAIGEGAPGVAASAGAAGAK